MSFDHLKHVAEVQVTLSLRASQQHTKNSSNHDNTTIMYTPIYL